MFYVGEDQKATFLMSYDFPLIVHETYLKDKPRGFNDWHWHEEMQFSYVLEGEMILSCQGNDYLLGAGSGIFINSNWAHMSRPTTEDSARFITLNIQPSLLTLFHGSVVEQKYYLPYTNDPNLQVIAFSPDNAMQSVFLDELLKLFTMIRDKNFGYELETYGQLLHLWHLLLTYSAGHTTTPTQPERKEAHDMLTYIHENYAKPISLDDLSALVHLSKGECCRLFRSTYGVSIFTHITNYRVSQSIPLLTGSQLSMTAIAEACGFNSPSYFTKNFREKVGVTPLQYRRNAADLGVRVLDIDNTK